MKKDKGETLNKIANLICDRDNGRLSYSELIVAIEEVLSSQTVQDKGEKK